MLTAQGFKRRLFADFLTEMEAMAKELFGEEVDTSQNEPLGKLLRIIAYQRAEEEEQAEQIWNNSFVDTAEGIHLDHRVKRALIQRKEWRKATGTLTVHLNENTVLPAGTLVAKKNKVMYKTLSHTAAVKKGTYQVETEAVSYGEIGNAQTGEITKIVNPVVGFNSVTNEEPFTNGQDQETDDELRRRYYESIGKNGNRRTETIRARLLDEVEGVRSCYIVENDTMLTDKDGRPPKSFETFVLGGETEEIAKKIFQAKPGGIQAYGRQYVNVADTQGISHTIGFTQAEVVSVFVKVHVKRGPAYQANGDEQIKEKIVQFIGGTGNGVQYNGLAMNEDVIQARLEARLFVVEGLEDARLLLSTDNKAFAEKNIPISLSQVAETDWANIEVLDLV